MTFIVRVKMSNESANYVCFSVVLTVLICIILFLPKEKETSEIGRYAWGPDYMNILDTADGTVYMIEKIEDNKLTILQSHLPTGILTNRKTVEIK
jgi:hypothetical protein